MNAKNVIPMTTPTENPQQIDESKGFAALNALDHMKAKLVNAASVSAAAWTKEKTEARQDLHGPIRDGDNLKASQKRQALLFRESNDNLAICDKMIEDAKAESNAWKRKIAGVDEAVAEVRALGRSDSRQGDLLAKVETAVAGLGWCSPGTSTTVYTALKGIEAEGVELSQTQQALLNDMNSAGLEAIDLGLDAAEAIEADENVEAPDDADAPASPESADIPF